MFLFVAPFVLGERAVPAFPDPNEPEAWKGWTPALSPKMFGRDILLTLDWTG
jgi:hypothetical protein